MENPARPAKLPSILKMRQPVHICFMTLRTLGTPRQSDVLPAHSRPLTLSEAVRSEAVPGTGDCLKSVWTSDLMIWLAGFGMALGSSRVCRIPTL